MAELQRDHSLWSVSQIHTYSTVDVAADAAEIYAAAFVQQNADGYAVMAGDTGAVGPVIGVNDQSVPDQTGNPDGTAQANVYQGLYKRPFAAANPPTDADMFKTVYAANNFDVTNDATKPVLGVMVGIDNDAEKCTVLIGAQALASTRGTLATVLAPLGEATLADGTALAQWVDGAGATPGHDVAGSEYKCIRWNPNATPGTIALSFPLPPDLDSESDLNVYLLAAKEAAGGDTPSFTVGAYFQTLGVAYDADADAGGESNDLTDTAKVMQLAVVVIDAADVPAVGITSPGMVTLTIAPTAGDLPTDDVLLGAVMLVYSRK
jgi:hypothetical protein